MSSRGETSDDSNSDTDGNEQRQPNACVTDFGNGTVVEDAPLKLKRAPKKREEKRRKKGSGGFLGIGAIGATGGAKKEEASDGPAVRADNRGRH